MCDMHKRLVTGLVVALIVLGGGAFAYASDAPLFDILRPQGESEAREARRIGASLPQVIDGYVLSGEEPGKVHVTRECTQDAEPYCTLTIIAEYRKQGGTHGIFVHLLKAESGVEALRSVVDRESTPETLDGQQVVRVEKHELAWYPTSGYDVILTQEGIYQVNDRGTVDYQYPNTATGENPVTRFFFEKYPPAK